MPAMDRQAFLTKWSTRADDLRKLGALVNGDRLIGEFLTELEQLFRGEESELLTLTEAASYSGYSADHLARLLRDGDLENAGRRHRPRVRRGDLPRKPHSLRPEPPSPFLTDSKRQIAMSVVNSETKETR